MTIAVAWIIFPGRGIFGEQTNIRFQWRSRCRERICVAVFVKFAKHKSSAAVGGISVAFIAHSPTRSNQYVIWDFLHFGYSAELPNFAIDVVKLILDSVPDSMLWQHFPGVLIQVAIFEVGLFVFDRDCASIHFR